MFGKTPADIDLNDGEYLLARPWLEIQRGEIIQQFASDQDDGTWRAGSILGNLPDEKEAGERWKILRRHYFLPDLNLSIAEPLFPNTTFERSPYRYPPHTFPDGAPYVGIHKATVTALLLPQVQEGDDETA